MSILCFSSLSRSLWMASLPSNVSTAPCSLVLLADLLRVHSIALFVSLTKMLNSTGSSTDPRGKSAFTVLHLDTEPWTAALSVADVPRTTIYMKNEQDSLSICYSAVSQLDSTVHLVFRGIFCKQYAAS